jgi:hypothetical protein
MVKKESNMYKTRIEENHFDEEGNLIPKRVIIEVPLTYEMIQDCFSYAPVDAPSEIKSMLMEILGETIDKIILGERPDYVDEQWLRRKLIEVKVS